MATTIDWNSKRPLVKSTQPGSRFKVTEIFSSIQTEGPLAGTPAVFVRLAGCNLSCSFCDTDYSESAELSVEDIMWEVLRCKAPGIKHVVITGGEPFLWSNLAVLVKRFERKGLMVQIETSGSVAAHYSDDFANCIIVCSPKTPEVKLDVAGDWYWKLLVSGETPVPKAYDPIEAGEADASNVFYQPLWGDKLSEEKAIEKCKQTGCRLSYQYHKHLGID